MYIISAVDKDAREIQEAYDGFDIAADWLGVPHYNTVQSGHWGKGVFHGGYNEAQAFYIVDTGAQDYDAAYAAQLTGVSLTP